MKNVKNIIAALLIAVSFTNTANAQSAAGEPLTVKYIGMEENYLLFQVEVNTNANFSLFKINDKSEGELFSQSWKNSSKPLTFKIEKKDSQELSFTLVSGKKAFSKNFATSTNTVETTSVTEAEVVKL
jgi:hypothetical protein